MGIISGRMSIGEAAYARTMMAMMIPVISFLFNIILVHQQGLIMKYNAPPTKQLYAP